MDGGTYRVNPTSTVVLTRFIFGHSLDGRHFGSRKGRSHALGIRSVRLWSVCRSPAHITGSVGSRDSLQYGSFRRCGREIRCVSYASARYHEERRFRNEWGARERDVEGSGWSSRNCVRMHAMCACTMVPGADGGGQTPRETICYARQAWGIGANPCSSHACSPYTVLAQEWESSYQAMGILPAVEPFLNIMGACHTSVSGRGNIEHKY